MKSVSKFVIVITMVALFISGFANSINAADVPQNIMDIVASDDRFDTLETAVKAAELADTLASADNTFTVFAPTDAAFAAVDAATLNSLLADPTGSLTQVLLYHVVAGEKNAAAVLASNSLDTAQGQSLNVNLQNGLPFVNNSQIIITDIPAKNGIIHVIDAVLVPNLSAPAASAAPAPAAASAASGTIVDVAIANGNFDTLVAAVTAAGLADTLADPNSNFTVFAPTDAAFAALPVGTVEALLADPTGQLTDILLFHVVNDSLMRNQVATDDNIPTLLEGATLDVNTDDNANILDIEGAKLVLTDIQTSNGIIHVIDAVMLP